MATQQTKNWVVMSWVAISCVAIYYVASSWVTVSSVAISGVAILWAALSRLTVVPEETVIQDTAEPALEHEDTDGGVGASKEDQCNPWGPGKLPERPNWLATWYDRVDQSFPGYV